ncbi:hypothetical protein DdX_08146 [Ditylenchus destructor]|uniref:Uncharacterized protein n=1 Tax=Ditylenchus destructor TaxID=166010 RepID=A0AAD4N3Y0_9BILA|nr:hypothetical protein DdX_08146 [Ditylenchus destructor]
MASGNPENPGFGQVTDHPSRLGSGRVIRQSLRLGQLSRLTSLRFSFFKTCSAEYTVLQQDIGVMIEMACDGGFQFHRCGLIISDIFSSKDDTTFKIGSNLDRKENAQELIPGLEVLQ